MLLPTVGWALLHQPVLRTIHAGSHGSMSSSKFLETSPQTALGGVNLINKAGLNTFPPDRLADFVWVTTPSHIAGSSNHSYNPTVKKTASERLEG